MRHVLLSCVLIFVAVSAPALPGAEVVEGKPGLTPDDIVREKLEKTRVSFAFDKQPATEALDLLQTLGNINIVPDRREFTGPDRTVTLTVRDVPLEVALKRVLEQLGMDYVIQDGVVFVSDEETLRKRSARAERIFFADKPSETDLKVYRQLKETQVSFQFTEQPIMEALDFLQTLGNTSVVPDRSTFEDPKQKITLKLTNVPLWTAMKLVTEQLGLRPIIRDGVLLITDDAGIEKAEAEAAEAARFAAAVEKVKAAGPDDLIAALDRQVLRKLEETTVSFTFNEQPVLDGLEYLSTVGKVNIVPDRRLRWRDKTVTLKVVKVSLETAIRLIAEQVALRHVVRGGVVFLSDKEGVTKWLAEAGEVPMHDVDPNSRVGQTIRKQLAETKVSFTFHEQPVMEACDFLSTLGNVSMVIDRDALKDADRTVTLKLHEVPLSTALKLLTEQLGLRYAIRDGRVFISDEKGVRRK